MEDVQKTRKPSSNKVKQQQMQAYRPVYTPRFTVILFSALSVCFFTFGSISLALALQIEEHQERYDNCKPVSGDTCVIDFELDSSMSEPVFLYYEMHNFYQNHRLYVKSRSFEQLQGEDEDKDDVDSRCDPIITNKDGDRKWSYDGYSLDPNDPANPCGLAAHTVFTDSFRIPGKQFSHEGLSWDSDLEYLYKRTKNWKEVQWLDVEDERFISWMKIAVHPTFRKLWGVIEEDLDAGSYSIEIENNYDVSKWDGEKHFVLTTANGLGGRNVVLGVALLCGGGLALLAALAVCIVSAFVKPEEKPYTEIKWT